MEASHARQQEIAPGHFFLGLLKAADLDWASVLGENPSFTREDVELIEADAGRLRHCYERVNMDVTKVRRQMRKVLAKDGARHGSDHAQKIRRSSATRGIFAKAEKIAEKRDGLVVPIDLLLALLEAEKDSAYLAQALGSSGSSATDLIKVITS